MKLGMFLNSFSLFIQEVLAQQIELHLILISYHLFMAFNLFMV